MMRRDQPHDALWPRASDRTGGGGSAKVSWWLLVLSAVPWQVGNIYSGSNDWTVYGKALVASCALLLALVSRSQREPQRPPRLWNVIWVYLWEATLAALLAITGILPSLILVGRLAIFLVCAVVVWKLLGGRELLRTHVACTATLSIVGAASGLVAPLPVWRGRLGSTIPPLHPNELALAAAFTALALFMLWLPGRGSPRYAMPGVALMLVIVIGTASRTAALGLALAFVLAILTYRATSGRRQVLLFVVPVFAIFLALFPPSSVRSWWDRHDKQHGAETLNSRENAWTAAFHADTPVVQRWFGRGLVVKQVKIHGVNKEQVLDSSWVSGIVQTGYVGVAVLMAVLLACWLCALRIRPGAHRTFAVSLLALLTLRSFTESALFDASLSFVTLLCLILLIAEESDIAVDAHRDDLEDIGLLSS